MRTDPAVDERRRRRLAEIVADRAEHDRDLLRARKIVDAPPRLIDHLQRVDPDVAFGMPLGLLRAAVERLHLRKQLRDDRRARAPARSRPTAVGASSSFSISPQMRSAGRSSSGIDAAQRARFVVERESEPRGELNRAKHAQAVVGERRRIDDAEQRAAR